MNKWILPAGLIQKNGLIHFTYGGVTGYNFIIKLYLPSVKIVFWNTNSRGRPCTNQEGGGGGGLDPLENHKI